MQAIQVKYLPATHNKPYRLKAWANSKMKLIKTIDCSTSYESQARDAARELANTLGWHSAFRMGKLPNGDLVWVPKRYFHFNDGF